METVARKPAVAGAKLLSPIAAEKAWRRSDHHRIADSLGNAMKALRFVFAVLLVAIASPVRAEDGYEAWLRYRPLDAAMLARTAPAATALVTGRSSPTLDVAAKELRTGLGAMLARPLASATAMQDGAILIGTPASSPLV